MWTWEIVAVLALVAVVLYLFIREVLPVPVTAVLAAAVLMVTGILSPAQGLSGFSSEATVTVLAMFVLSAGIERSGTVELLTRAMSRLAGKGLRRQTLALGVVAGPLSGFVNNTPVVAVLIPAAVRMAREAGRRPSKLLMPLSFFAMAGGTLTLIGTSTNLLGNALLDDYEAVTPFGFFSFFLVGLVALAVVAVYFMTIGVRLLPDRGEGDVVDRFDLKGFMGEFEVPGDAPVAGKRLNEAALTRSTGIQVLRVFRGGHTIASPRAGFVLEPGDLLLVQGSRERLESLPESTGLRSLAEMKHGLDDEDDEDGEDEPTATAELVVAPNSRLEGRTLEELRFRDRYDALVLAIRHHDRVAIGSLSKTRLRAGDVLLVQATQGALDRLEETSLFFLTRERPQEAYRRNKAAVAVAILVAVVALSATGVLPIVAAALAGAVAMVLTGCLKIDEFLGSVQWDIVLLLAGIIPLGVALKETGAAELLAGGLTVMGIHVHGLVFLILVFAGTSLITSVLSNNASVVLLLPIAVEAAHSMGFSGRPFALAVMLAASTSLITPVGYQTNTMVYAPGEYRFVDFLRVGGPLNLLLAVAIPLAIAWLFPLRP